MTHKKIAFVAMNYGGPQNLDEVKPYLRNIFKDKAILRAPFFIRYGLAYKIAAKRAEKSKNIFTQIGGKSPINEKTLSQIKAIENILKKHSDINIKGFMIQRYAAPFAKDVMKNIIEYNPDKVILLPMYPQFSTTTTSSSLQDFLKHAPKELRTKVSSIQYFYTNEGWQNYFVEKIFDILQAETPYDFTLLYSAHSIPKAYIDAGDVYEEQVKESLRLIHFKLEEKWQSKIPCHLVWQSKVGKMQWLSPSVEETITQLKDKALIVIPFSFVAENSETLVELDMDMKKLALAQGCPAYHRIPTPDDNKSFITGLAQQILELINE